MNVVISIVPEVSVREEVARGRLTAVRITGADLLGQRTMGVVYKKGRYLSIAARKFLQVLEEHLGDD